ncbi:hypothetical protein LEMA_uP002480.1 [Plenodomus lingam JN3]|uniref:Antifungal protein n=1 Tax=Leptosphaeria maculans (strain JN3 / isolate v23.1.3 / race Av1-4-5-6-7-8) TaxID=985895 RepID=E5AE22_LEPMJ|nr:hypothetical protein LEMA_uP002480.1 [Plenodomus lingam JN3]CBY01461.1 hypothetical protein LEMA_uP002480.1 [Plenodomus lingam JN3]
MKFTAALFALLASTTVISAAAIPTPQETRKYIKYKTLGKDRVPCDGRHSADHKCKKQVATPANPYTRGCEGQERCRQKTSK